MDVDQVGSPQCSDWDVNGIIKLIKTWVPRRRWCCLNSQHFGPLFSVPALIEVPLTDIERLLNAPEVAWLNWVDNGTIKSWLHRPIVPRPFNDGAIVDSTINNFPVLLYIDPHGPPTCQPEDQLDAVRKGWDSLDGATQASITEKAANGVYGIEPPRRGWKGLECPPPARLPRLRTRPSRDGESTEPRRVRAYQPPTRAAPPRNKAKLLACAAGDLRLPVRGPEALRHGILRRMRFYFQNP